VYALNDGTDGITAQTGAIGGTPLATIPHSIVAPGGLHVTAIAAPEVVMVYSTLSQHPELSFSEGLPDVRGWEVRTAADDEKVGKVHDLVIDSTNQIRYLDIDSGGLLTSKRILLPLGAAQVDERDDVIWVPGMTKQQFKSLPEFTGDTNLVTADYERQLYGVFPASASGERSLDAQRFYERRFGEGERAGVRGGESRITRSEEELAIGKRAVQAGEVLIRKSVETERVSQPVTRRREEVEIERRPVEGMAAGAPDITEDEIRVPIMEEEVVVEKRPVVKEEVVVKKRAIEETEEVEADLRKEKIDVDKSARNVEERTRGRRARGEDEGPRAP
jgi:uncharacterized protein (TIGR02271 family)